MELRESITLLLSVTAQKTRILDGRVAGKASEKIAAPVKYAVFAVCFLASLMCDGEKVSCLSGVPPPRYSKTVKRTCVLWVSPT